MNLKKSIFSYIIWAFFAVFCFFGVFAAVCAAEIRELLNWPFAGVIAAVCGYLILTAAVFFALRTLAMEIGDHCKEKVHMEKAVFIVLPAMILVGAMLYLVLYLLKYAPLPMGDDSFYSQAVVSAGNYVPFTVHGASWLYSCLLHVMLLIFGNTPFAGVVLQIILFFVCLLFLYFGMQSYTGVLPAAVSMAALAFLPVSRQFLLSLTPELFYLACYLFGFWLNGVLFQSFRKKNAALRIQYLGAVLLGLYIGFLLYLDLWGVSLFFFSALLCSWDREKRKQAVGINLSVLLGMAAGSVLFVLFASQMGQMEPARYLREVFSLYTQNVGRNVDVTGNVLLPDMTLTGSVLLISFAFFVVPAFFLWKRNQNSAFVLNVFFAYMLSVFSAACLDMQMFVSCCWCILAGAGFYGIVRQPEDAEVKTAEMLLKKAAKKEPELSGEGTVKKKGAAEKKMQNEVQKEMNTEKVRNEGKEQEKPAPGEPLHNPLPIPKKKSHAQADFGFQVKEADMKFDLEVADDDDFDV